MIFQNPDENQGICISVVLNNIQMGVYSIHLLPGVYEGLLVQLVGVVSHCSDECAVNVCTRRTRSDS